MTLPRSFIAAAGDCARFKELFLPAASVDWYSFDAFLDIINNIASLFQAAACYFLLSPRDDYAFRQFSHYRRLFPQAFVYAEQYFWYIAFSLLLFLSYFFDADALTRLFSRLLWAVAAVPFHCHRTTRLDTFHLHAAPLYRLRFLNVYCHFHSFYVTSILLPHRVTI